MNPLSDIHSNTVYNHTQVIILKPPHKLHNHATHTNQEKSPIT